MMLRKILFAVSAALIAGCSFRPVIAPMPTLAPMTRSSIAALQPAPKLPDAKASACPAGSGLEVCFDKVNAAAAAAQFDLLVSDRDYCRSEYEKAARGEK